jgi:hypothetical protein
VPPTPRNVPLFFNLALPRPSTAPPRTYCVYGLKNWSIFDKSVSESDFFNFDFFKKMVYRFTGFDEFQPLSADRFTGFGTDLLVIPTGKPVRFTDSRLLKYEI